MSTTAYVHHLPVCDVCKYELNTDGVPATFDARTLDGRWASLCQLHFTTHTDGRLGTGRGQALVVGPRPEPDASAIHAAICQRRLQRGRGSDRRPRHLRVPVTTPLSDTLAMDMIADVLNDDDWNADHFDEIADVVRLTDRLISPFDRQTQETSMTNQQAINALRNHALLTDDKGDRLALGTAAALLEVHEATGISLDNWTPVREFVEFQLGARVTENGV
jgi:hypothetical protein